MFLLSVACGLDNNFLFLPKPTTLPVEEDTGASPTGITGVFGTLGLNEGLPSWGDGPIGGTYGLGVFTEEPLPFVNYTYWSLTGICLPEELPEGETVPITGERCTVSPPTFSAGWTLRLGDLLLQRAQSAPGVLEYTGFGGPIPEGASRALSIGGDLAPYASEDAIVYTDPMVVTSPDPNQPIYVGPDDVVLPITWTPQPIGDVLLITQTTVTHLVDDGEHVFPLTLAAFGGTNDPLWTMYIELSRQVTTPVDAAGNTVSIETRSDQRLWITRVDLEGRLPLEIGVNAAETCEAAKLLPSLPPGEYQGDISFAGDDHRPSLSYSHWPAAQGEWVVPIDLVAGEALVLTYWRVQDAALYVLSSECDDADLLAVGVQSKYQPGIESLTYLSPIDQRVFVVLDAEVFAGAGPIALDVYSP